MGILQRWRQIVGNDQKVAFTGTAAASAAFGAQTYAVMLSCSQSCHIAFGQSPVATANNWLLKNTDPGIVLGVAPGEKISAIQDSAGGNLYIMELTE